MVTRSIQEVAEQSEREVAVLQEAVVAALPALLLGTMWYRFAYRGSDLTGIVVRSTIAEQQRRVVVGAQLTT